MEVLIKKHSMAHGVHLAGRPGREGKGGRATNPIGPPVINLPGTTNTTEARTSPFHILGSRPDPPKTLGLCCEHPLID